jgi:hypothetical protein
MNAKITAAVAIIVAIAGLGTPVYAQSRVKPLNTGERSKSGASLTGINDRTSRYDFSTFFPTVQNSGNISSNNDGNNNFAPNADTSWQVGDQFVLRRNLDQPLSAPNSVLFPQVNQSSFDANNGVQVQYDLLRGVDGNK